MKWVSLWFNICFWWTNNTAGTKFIILFYSHMWCSNVDSTYELIFVSAHVCAIDTPNHMITSGVFYLVAYLHAQSHVLLLYRTKGSCLCNITIYYSILWYIVLTITVLHLILSCLSHCIICNFNYIFLRAGPGRTTKFNKLHF